jgi:hypothetical protein
MGATLFHVGPFNTYLLSLLSLLHVHTRMYDIHNGHKFGEHVFSVVKVVPRISDFRRTYCRTAYVLVGDTLFTARYIEHKSEHRQAGAKQ